MERRDFCKATTLILASVFAPSVALATGDGIPNGLLLYSKNHMVAVDWGAVVAAETTQHKAWNVNPNKNTIEKVVLSPFYDGILDERFHLIVTERLEDMVFSTTMRYMKIDSYESKSVLGLNKLELLNVKIIEDRPVPVIHHPMISVAKHDSLGHYNVEKYRVANSPIEFTRFVMDV